MATADAARDDLMAVYESTRPMDLRLVAKVIRDQRLNPKPIASGWRSWRQGFRSIQIEQYEWGQVVFVTDGDTNWSSTLALVGTVDWDEGTVTDGEGFVTRIPVPWYGEIDLEASEETMDTKNLPECLGYHDHCATCDGGYNESSGSIENVCSWRTRCYALKLHLMEVGKPVGDLFDEFADATALNVFLADLERKKMAQIVPPAIILPESRGKARGTLSGKTKERPRKRRRKADPERFAELEPLARAFVRRLKLSLSRLGYEWKPKRSLALPGDCFLNRVTKRSNYSTVYVATAGVYAKVAVIRYKLMSHSLSIAFNSTWDKASALPGTRLRKLTDLTTPVEWRGVRSVELARGAARLLGRMIRRGVVKLPPPRPKKEDE